MSSPDSSAVELAPIREMLRLYCRALSERAIDLQDLKQLVDKEIGWSKSNVATSDGAAIFLPAVIEHYEEWSDNYDFLKVALTQQAGHIEFGSFEFEFTRASTRFDDLRPKLSPPPEYHDHDHGHEGHHEEPSVTELTRLFKLFPSKRLALDVFSIAESARIEARVMREYRGIAGLYEILRERALSLRPRTIFLPAREALLEFMARISLGQTRGLEIPRQHAKIAREIAALIALLSERNATVEDAGEATLRIYARLARIENRALAEDGFALMDIDREAFNPSDRWSEDAFAESTLPRMHGRDSEYLSPQPVDYRGEFRPELAQLLTQTTINAREQRKTLTADEIADLLRSQRVPKRRASEEDGEEQDPETQQMAHNLMRELLRRDPRMQSIERRPGAQSDDDGVPLSATQPNCFIYDEWDFAVERYRDRWCRVYEKTMAMGDLQFYRQTLSDHAGLQQRIRREFEQVVPEIYRKEKRLPDGPDHDLDAAIEAIADLRIGVSPSEKIFWRHHKIERDVAVAFLLDMSGSTGEAIGRTAAGGAANMEAERGHRRIIDVEREVIVLMMDALESIGDRYGVYGFSGHGRDNCEFYVIKDLGEEFSLDIAKRFGRIGPLHATRMGPAIRHAAAKLRLEQTRSKFLFLISDGRPQDRGYSQEGSDKAYALQDTRRAFLEARREGVHPFCLTVDKEGNDYLRTMMDDFSYEVLADVSLLPERLPQLYKKLTT
jgi:hypothetical protein